MKNADCHIHMVLDGQYWKAAIEDHAHRVNETLCHARLARYQALGYTYLRDGGDRWGVGARAKALAPAYGITYRTPLAPLCLAGHYGKFIGLTYENPTEFAKLVVRQRREGADFVKIMISGLMDFDCCGRLTEEGLPPTLIQELVHIAHEEGQAVMAHGNGARTVEAAALAGVDSIEHGAYLDRDALEAMKNAGTVWVPTLSTVGNLKGKGRFDDEQTQKILESTTRNLQCFAAMGGLIAPGSDAGAWQVPHGCETEYDLLQQAGIDQQTLEAGTKRIMETF
ncbi:MAG: Xaa-Pro dipeptidase [Ruminococcaceae bacterium]|nr:Xaa-Pro dipeptidase [Oscillospiraceae bacterium]